MTDKWPTLRVLAVNEKKAHEEDKLIGKWIDLPVDQAAMTKHYKTMQMKKSAYEVLQITIADSRFDDLTDYADASSFETRDIDTLNYFAALLDVLPIESAEALIGRFCTIHQQYVDSTVIDGEQGNIDLGEVLRDALREAGITPVVEVDEYRVSELPEPPKRRVSNER